MIRYTFSAPVKDRALQEFRAWLNKNQDRIAKHAPEGWKLEGLFFGVYGLSDSLFEVHWTLDSYGALDNAVAAAEASAGSGDGWAAIQQEWFQFLDASGSSGRLLKSVDHPNLCVLAS
ncbi:MAG: hypothetical protein AAGD01_05495 [Acidobacteriota bacterium]